MRGLRILRSFGISAPQDDVGGFPQSLTIAAGISPSGSTSSTQFKLKHLKNDMVYQK